MNLTKSYILHTSMFSLSLQILAVFLAILQSSYGHYHREPCLELEPQPQYVVSPQYSLGSGSIFASDPGMVIFTNTFAKTVFNSDILSDVFDLSQTTPLEYSKFLYKYNLDLYKSKGFKNAVEMADFAARGTRNLDVLTMPLMVRILHNTAGNFLFAERILRVECAESLAFAYAETFEKVARIYLTADPTSKFMILAEACFKFMHSVDKNFDKTYPILTYYFGNEWFVANVNYKYIGY